jgi:predicted porin
MKKSLLALAVLAASGAAMAQSSVTLYGVADTGVTYTSGKEDVYGLTHLGGNTNSRLGFRGVEDLGGGLKATFQLEAGMGIDDGKNYFDPNPAGGGLTFSRISKLGIEGGFGAVSLGRELTASYMAVSRYDVFGDTGIGASLAWNPKETAYNARTQNAISYYTPTISGFRAGINYGFGEQVKARDSRYVGVGLAYDNGPISVGFGYDRQNNVAAAAAKALFDTTVAQDLSTWQLGGSYNFGVAKAAALYKETEYKDIPGSDAPTAKLKTFGLGVTAPVGAGEVRASYNHHRLTGLGDTLKADQFSLGYVHNMSKRTALYGTYAYIKNKDNNGDGMAMQLNGAMAGAGLKDSGAQHGFQVGVRHAF